MTIEIAVCMGSSCFARGNDRNLAVLEAYLARHELDAAVSLTGTRCESACSHGPNIRIDGTLHRMVDEGTLLDLLEACRTRTREPGHG
jgi:NADH:ubiquinone oxidoreductase subunit E